MHPSLLAASIAPVCAQDAAKSRLENSPRHGEWISLKSDDRPLKAFVVYPESKDRATAVLVIHEIFGLTDWVRGVCDQLAEAGYIACAPDLLSGQNVSPGDDTRRAISELPPAQVTADLNATAKYLTELPAANGKLAVAGFCWGGSQAFRYAAENPALTAAFVFYGSAPEDAALLAKINAPVYGFYGENDARVTTTVPATESAMKAAGKRFEPVIYRDAGHGFMRTGEAPDATPANRDARKAAWTRWRELLRASQELES